MCEWEQSRQNADHLIVSKTIWWLKAKILVVHYSFTYTIRTPYTCRIINGFAARIKKKKYLRRFDRIRNEEWTNERKEINANERRKKQKKNGRNLFFYFRPLNSFSGFFGFYLQSSCIINDFRFAFRTFYSVVLRAFFAAMTTPPLFAICTRLTQIYQQQRNYSRGPSNAPRLRWFSHKSK